MAASATGEVEVSVVLETLLVVALVVVVTAPVVEEEPPEEQAAAKRAVITTSTAANRATDRRPGGGRRRTVGKGVGTSFLILLASQDPRVCLLSGMGAIRRRRMRIRECLPGVMGA